MYEDDDWGSTFGECITEELVIAGRKFLDMISWIIRACVVLVSLPFWACMLANLPVFVLMVAVTPRHYVDVGPTAVDVGLHLDKRV